MIDSNQLNRGLAPLNKRYRFGFILNTTVGNMTRYQNLRKYAERDPEVEFAWAPVNHHTPKDWPSRLRVLPAPLFLRARVLQQAWPVLGRLGGFDAVMIHLFEADLLASLRRCFATRPVHISSTDEAPIIDRENYPFYPHEIGKPPWRANMRLAIDRWRVRNTDQFVPFTRWGADILTRGCGAPIDRVHPLHVGMDLELWQSVPKRPRLPGQRLRVLFVGGDFVRKGGDLLVDVFMRHFQHSAELHIVSKQAPAMSHPDVHVYADMQPNDARLRHLYSEADVMVIPSTADIIPWAHLEALAMHLPVIATRVGATAEVVKDGETGFTIAVGDGEALREAIQRMIDRPDLAIQLGEKGRSLIETDYNSAVNVPSILQLMKQSVN